MEIKETKLKGLLEIQPRVFGDERGYFFESFREDKFNEMAGEVRFVQENQSFSTKGVLRGLHLQLGDHAQGKLVRVITGKVLDVAVDLREDSATFGQWYSVVLDSKKANMLYVPEGFAHGFYTIEDATFCYKCTSYYNKESESGILWNDNEININWNLVGEPLISEKDLLLPSFSDFQANTTKSKA